MLLSWSCPVAASLGPSLVMSLGQRTRLWGLTYFGAGAQGRRARVRPLQDQGAGRPAPLASLVLGTERLRLRGLNDRPLCTPPAPPGTG